MQPDDRDEVEMEVEAHLLDEFPETTESRVETRQGDAVGRAAAGDAQSVSGVPGEAL